MEYPKSHLYFDEWDIPRLYRKKGFHNYFISYHRKYSGQIGSRHGIKKSFQPLLFLNTGFYQFCCDGVYCPDCPLELNISTLGQNVTVNSAINLSCVNTSFTATLNTDRQPGNFAIKVSWTLQLLFLVITNFPNTITLDNLYLD